MAVGLAWQAPGMECWVVTDKEGQRFEHAGWFAAAQQYRHLVIDWAEEQDEFTEVMTGEPAEWRCYLEDDGFGGRLVVSEPYYVEMLTNDGVGGHAEFRLDLDPGAS